MWPAEIVLTCALSLLNRDPASFPRVDLVDVRPRFVSANAEAYVVDGQPPIHVLTTTSAFQEARRSVYRCGNLQALRKVASILVHEEWHLRHGADEPGAYGAQLSALLAMGAGPGNVLYSEVQRARQAAPRRRSARSTR